MAPAVDWHAESSCVADLPHQRGGSPHGGTMDTSVIVDPCCPLEVGPSAKRRAQYIRHCGGVPDDFHAFFEGKCSGRRWRYHRCRNIGGPCLLLEVLQWSPVIFRRLEREGNLVDGNGDDDDDGGRLVLKRS